MSEQYFTVNIRTYLGRNKPAYIGEDSLYKLLSDFSCPHNPDLEHFLIHNAIEFTKKDQSVTFIYEANLKCLMRVLQRQCTAKSPTD